MRQPAQLTRATRAVPAQGDSEDREEPLVALMMQVRASIVPAERVCAVVAHLTVFSRCTRQDDTAREAPLTRQTTADEAFKEIDHNGDGVIDKQELQRTLDGDGDGCVDRSIRASSIARWRRCMVGHVADCWPRC